jgi:chorismate lyase/3-hydroxybenzoate synthase
MSSDRLILDYVDAGAVPANPLLVVGYAADRPATLPAGCPFLRLELPPLATARYEMWTGGTPTYGESGTIAYAENGMVLFGSMFFADTDALAALAEAAYGEIFAFVAQSGYPDLQRLWNYLPDITGQTAEGERYRQFNLGRHAAFEALPAELASPPAATGIGCLGGGIGIYFMASRQPTRRIENPRQVSAFRYPAEYGPRSPTFSRAAVASLPEPALLISGTASIIGHASQHAGDIAAQTAETLKNIEILIREAGPACQGRRLQAKIYLRRPADQPLVAASLAAASLDFSQCCYLEAEICRPELLVEIEAVVV